MSDENKVAVVTGAARGIGRATAISLARRGFAIALADRLIDEMNDAAEEVQGHRRRCDDPAGERRRLYRGAEAWSRHSRAMGAHRRARKQCRGLATQDAPRDQRTRVR